MLLEAPPSRYRVVERGGRLTVIDTQGEGAVPSARDLIARDARTRTAEAGRTDRSPSAPRNARPPVPAFASAVEPRSFPRQVAAALTGGVRDDRGRLMLSTAPWLDAKGPRDVALSAAGEQAFGAVVLAVTAGLLVLLVALIAFSALLLPALLVGGVALSQAKPFVTRAIDAFARL